MADRMSSGQSLNVLDTSDKMINWYGLGLAARISMMLYGVWQDAQMAVKYTDVDYYVFTDAANLVTQGESPYLRVSYRYTPLLAWMLTVNIWLFPFCGKLIFIIFDVLVGHTIYNIIKHSKLSHQVARNCALTWLLNPLPIAVSSRGNAESIMTYLVLTSLSHLLKGRTVTAAVFYALAVHFKIYPIVYALPIYLSLGKAIKPAQSHKGNSSREQRSWSLYSAAFALWPNKERLKFITVSGLLLGGLTCFFYCMYGWSFLYETYLYHVVRGDIKHNFSPYFYLLYLTSDPVDGVPLCLRLLVFLPQALLLVAVALRYHQDQPLCWFLSTFLFVLANKVCTSQYFLWYLSLLPVILPHLRTSITQSSWLLAVWFGAQGLWLLPAYLLEFQGYNTFLLIWGAGLVFFIVNAALIYVIITNYKITFS